MLSGMEDHSFAFLLLCSQCKTVHFHLAVYGWVGGSASTIIYLSFKVKVAETVHMQASLHSDCDAPSPGVLAL